jgi:hypothetical protein
MKILIACEFTGVMRREFRARGHDAWSCDLLPAADNSLFHIQGDAIEAANMDCWDLMIAHPPCTRLCNSGVRWLYGGKGTVVDPEKWQAMIEGAEFYSRLWQADIPRIAIENPVMHKHARHVLDIQKHEIQFVQPWWFGDPFFKLTGFRSKNLPPLYATNRLKPPKSGTAEHKAWSKVHRASPGPNRWAERSATFPGIAAACAEQWGKE